MHRAVLASTIGVVGIAAALAMPSAAVAADLPANAQLSTFDSQDGFIASVNPANAALTTTGSAPDTHIIDWDVADGGLGYGIGLTGTAPDWKPYLWSVDLAVPAVTSPLPIYRDGYDSIVCASIDYTAGVVLAQCTYWDSTIAYYPYNSIGTIDPSNGEFTDVWVYGAGATEQVLGLAFDPTSGLVVVGGQHFEEGEEVWDILSLDLEAETVETVATSALAPLAADFDSNGLLWLTGYATNETYFDSLLGWVDIDAGTTGVVGSLGSAVQPADELGYFALTTWTPAPALAATGVDSTAPLALGVVALTLGGALLLAVRRRQRREAIA